VTDMSNEKPNKAETTWTMSQERQFMETILYQRFNFFLIFFSLIIAGSINSKDQCQLCIVLTIGTVVCWLIAGTLWRSQRKLNIALGELFKNTSHPARIIRDIGGGFPALNIIGYCLPVICSVILTTGAVLAFAKVLTVPAIPSSQTTPKAFPLPLQESDATKPSI
jgi:hypothetical protein